ncbi:LPS export ABC transporter periplasmic protein LptC [Sulfitobacter sp. JBTF-M27]|uniref:LPS export ABC transporter periplasmic protein LptC n=1 Tax=Sulfitobacter sediminilitoris TaxID=2698830 RepID=A0A6P0C940_9RHOB|nr:LPS export ABC transporter periplasmic protein LptC [Sulfitobacter sediminilitoris]NEK21616.1 LPS export ABC transporter periplasmic protein LptC [Sulfitobacter sediminilitoris]
MQLDRYSRMVGWLKVLLPLMALGLLSTLFLLSRVVDPESVIPFADKEIQDRLRDQQVTGPVYYGVTPEGDELSFAAEKLTTPKEQTGANDAEQVEVTMKLASGSRVTLTSDHGRFDMAANRADLDGDVVITTSTGYQIKSDKLVTRLSTLDVHSPGPVHADGPLGTLDAGAMQLNAGKAGDAAQLVFTNGVKLIYVPKPDEE